MYGSKRLTRQKKEEIRTTLWRTVRRQKEILSGNGLRIDPLKCLQHFNHRLWVFVVLPDGEVENGTAKTDLLSKVIKISESTYVKACDGDPISRRIILHEVGHILLHSHKGSAAFTDTMEQEADFFSIEALAPIELVAAEMLHIPKPFMRVVGDSWMSRIFGIEAKILLEQRRLILEEMQEEGFQGLQERLHDRLKRIDK